MKEQTDRNQTKRLKDLQLQGKNRVLRDCFGINSANAVFSSVYNSLSHNSGENPLKMHVVPHRDKLCLHVPVKSKPEYA